MAAYLFQLDLPEMSERIAATIPLHRQHINGLFASGRVLSYSVSSSRSTIWCVVNAEEQSEAMELIVAMPLFPHFTEVSCHPLLFHNTLPSAMPGISLN